MDQNLRSEIIEFIFFFLSNLRKKRSIAGHIEKARISESKYAKGRVLEIWSGPVRLYLFSRRLKNLEYVFNDTNTVGLLIQAIDYLSVAPTLILNGLLNAFF